MKQQYEFCGKLRDENNLESTTIVGFYCIACHKIVIEESKDAIKKIQERKRNK